MKNFAARPVDLLVYLANQYPRYVGTEDVKHIVKGEIRTRQRLLKSLSEAGYLEVLRTNPLSYRINPDRFEAFGALNEK